MNWDDLTSLWRRQEDSPLPDSYLEKLNATFTDSNRSLSRRLFWRDTREILACIIVAVVFAMAAVKKGPGGWPLWIAVVLTSGVGVRFVKERIRAHRGRIGPDAPLLTKIDSEIAELQHQRHLIMHLGKWYLGPIFVAWITVLASTGFHGLSNKLHTPLQMWGYGAGGVLLFGAIWKLNRWRVKRRTDPRIAELERLRGTLTPQE